MTDSKAARTTTRRVSWIVVGGLLVAIGAIAPAFAYQSPPFTAPTARPTIDIRLGEELGAPGGGVEGGVSAATAPSRSGHGGGLGAADGAVPDGTTVFDATPGVANLDPGLLRALRQAATDAAKNGVEFLVESGWRSPAYQEQLLREAISTYGSEREAVRWVATPETSPHVSGDAVDIGPTAAIAWLSRHGARYGLCQIYRNEPWHYELRTSAVDQGCPPMYADPTHDPRMQ